MQQNDYSVICPVDPQNPFRNPTESPGYSPDYSRILPETGMQHSCLTLYPTRTEKAGIRRFFSMTFLMLLFDLVTAATIYVALQLIVTTVLRQSDLRTLGTLPENYPQILNQYLCVRSI